MPLLHLYVAGGFVLLSLFYNSVLNGFINKNIILITVVLFSLFTVINSSFIQKIYVYNSYALTIESIIVIIFSLSTYMLLLNDIVKEKNTYTIKSLNWINSGLFIYYSSGLLIFYFGNLITAFSPSYLVEYTWVLHAFFSTVMYACFFTGLWKQPKN